MPEFFSQFADFHFLRPYWLLLLLLIPLCYQWLKSHRHRSSSWAEAIDKQLLKHLLDQQLSPASRIPLYLILVVIFISSLALAGPTWNKIPQPVHKSEDALVILLDLSLSMQASDIKPSRLIKARHKIIDILEQREQGLTALVAYAGDAHIVSPLTDDTDTIKAMVPALSPLIMPALGSNSDAAIELAQQLLKDGGINKGRILLITDGITESDVDAIADLMDETKHSLSVLAAGTAEGGPIPLPKEGFLKEGQDIVIAKTDMNILQSLSRKTGARLAQLRIDESDIDFLLKKEIINLEQNSRQVEREFDQWEEQGPWLVLLLIPLVAFGFRKGWLFSIVLLISLEPSPVYAFEWRDLWETKDQQGSKAFQAGEHKKAAELFESKDWKASSAYRQGEHQAAADVFSSSQHPEASYNQGNALAKAGKLEEALEAYEKTLEQQPEHEDALFNKNLIEQMMQNQENQDQQENQDGDQSQEQNDQNNSDDQQSQQNQDNEQQDNEDQNQENQDSQQDQNNEQQNDENQDNSQSQNQSEQEPEQEQQQSQQDSEEEKQNQEQQESKPEESESGEESEQQAAQSQLSDEQKQAAEQWLRRIQEDPGGLLKRKFNYQYQQRQLENQYKPRQENEPIW